MLAELASGGALGLLGSGLSSIMGYFNKKQEHKQSIELMALEVERDKADHLHSLQLMKFEGQYRSEQLQIETEGALAVAEVKALEQSYASDVAYKGNSKLLEIAEFCRTMARPVLMAMLVLLTSMIYFTSTVEVRLLIAKAVVAMTATAVAWYFADRTVAKRVANKLL